MLSVSSLPRACWTMCLLCWVSRGSNARAYQRYRTCCGGVASVSSTEMREIPAARCAVSVVSQHCPRKTSLHQQEAPQLRDPPERIAPVPLAKGLRWGAGCCSTPGIAAAQWGTLWQRSGTCSPSCRINTTWHPTGPKWISRRLGGRYSGVQRIPPLGGGGTGAA